MSRLLDSLASDATTASPEPYSEEKPDRRRSPMRDRLPKRVSKALMPSARSLYPDRPEVVLESRPEFEAAAADAVLGDAGNLELSYKLAEAFANAADDLGFGPVSDTPRPFSRVWIMDAAGERREGVVLRCEYDEIAVFCPPTTGPFRPSSPKMRLSYRGAINPVEFDLHVNDAVRLPEALILHLTRPGGSGGIGRDKLRVHVNLVGGVRACGDVELLEWTEWHHCEVLDLSATGMRIQSDLPFGENQAVELTLVLDDGSHLPFEATAKIRWNRIDENGQRSQGLVLSDLDQDSSARYLTFVSDLLAANARTEPAKPTPSADLPPELMAKAQELTADFEAPPAGESGTALDIALQDLDRWMKLLNAPRKMRPAPSVLAEEVARCIDRVEICRIRAGIKSDEIEALPAE